MQVFGHEWIESETFYSVKSIEAIAQTPPNALLRINALATSIELVQHCQENGLRYALEIKSIEEAIYANLLGATYVLADKALATELMPIAQNYLFDTRVLAIVSQNEIEEMARCGVDGVVIK